MRPGNNVARVLFADVVDAARDTASEGTSLHAAVAALTDKDVLLADNATSLVVTVKKCRMLATEPRLLNADIDVLRHQLRVIANMCRVSLDMIDPDFNSG